jgi:hypothetical protein
VRAHSVYVEERTVYVCTCKAEFESMRDAEAHLRGPSAEKGKSPKPSKPKRQPTRRAEAKAVTVEEVEMPSSSLWTPTDQ